MSLPRQAYAAVAIAALLPILYILPLITPFWSARYLVVILIGIVGIPAVIANRQRPEAKAALVFAAVTASSAAVSGSAWAIFGDFGLGTGLLFVLGLIGSWAVGGISGDGRHAVVLACCFGAALNATMALAEVLLDLDEVGFGTHPTRASGFIGNPVFLGGYLAAAAWLVINQHLEDRRWWHLPLLTLLGAGIQLSGSRAALILVVIACGLGILRTCRVGLLVLAFAVVGIVGGSGVAAAADVASGTSRVVDSVSSGGTRARLEAWTSARHAVIERPLLGAGPGRFGVATSPHRTLRLAQAEGTERYFFDAHNLLVEHLVTTGVLGFAALVAWISLVLRRTRPLRDPLAAFGAGLLLMHLVQPQNVVLTPLAFLALGAAAPAMELPSWARRTSLGLGVATVPAVAYLAFGFFALDQARLDFEQVRADQARRILPGWTQVTEQAARVSALRARIERRPDLEQQALAYRRMAVAENPGDPRPLRTLVQYEGQLGLGDAQIRSLRRLYRIDPWSITALRGLGLHHADGGRARGDEARRAVSFLERSLLVGRPNPAVEDLIDSLRSRY